MKRRDFLLSSAGVLGGIASHPVFGQTQTRPCPSPTITVDGQTVNTPCLRTAIEAAAAALSPGQSTTSLADAGLGSDALYTIQWVNRFHYDHAKGKGHLLGKEAASQGSQRSNCVYDAGTNRWQYAIYGGDELGHIYESFAYSPADSMVFSGRWSSSPSSIQTWTDGAALTSWSATSTSPWTFSSTNSTQPVLCWHPNLFGPGDGGLIAIRLVSSYNVELVAWRRSTNAWSSIPGSAHATTDTPPQVGAIEYVRGLNCAIATFANGNTYSIGAGSGGATATAARIANPPIACRHAGGTNNVGILIDDPAGTGGPYILEKGGSNRVWKYTNNAWSQRSYTHPLPFSGSTDTNWCVASVHPLGVFWSKSSRSDRPSLLWRPND